MNEKSLWWRLIPATNALMFLLCLLCLGAYLNAAAELGRVRRERDDALSAVAEARQAVEEATARARVLRTADDRP